MLVRTEFLSFAIDPEHNLPMAVLKESGGVRTIPVPVDVSDAGIISIQAMNLDFKTPLTIELLHNVVENLGGKIIKFVIDDFSNNVFRSSMIVKQADREFKTECRITDVISLSVMENVPIFVNEEIFSIYNPSQNISPAERLRETIKSTDTLDLGRYFLN